MKADLVEYCDECEAPGGPAAPPILSRLGELIRRFPAASNGLLSITDQMISSGTSFVSAVLIGRMTSPDELGLYYLTLSVWFILLGIQEQVIGAPYTIYSKRRHGRELPEYAGSVWLHHLVLTAFGVGALLVGIVAMAIAGKAALVPGLWALTGVFPLLLLREGIRRFAIADLRLATAIVLDTAVAVVQLSGLALIGYFGQVSIFAVYGVIGGACALACAGWWVLAPKSIHFKRRRFLLDWKHNWSFAKWALRSYLVGNMTPYLMPWILEMAAGTAATGMLAAAATLVNATNVFLCGVGNVLTPQAARAFAEGGSKELSRVLLGTAALLATVLGAFCLALFLTGDRLAVLVYGGKYEGCGPVLVALAASALMTSLGMVAGTGLWAIDQPRSNFLADVCGLLVTLVAAAFLVLPLGALGAALALVAGTSMAAVVRTATLLVALGSSSLAASPLPHSGISNR